MTYKPLKELANDHDACFEIFNFVASDVEYGCVKNSPEYEFMVLWEHKPDYYDDAEPLHHIFIHHNGGIFWMKGEAAIDLPNVFALVDFIRSLGYSA